MPLLIRLVPLLLVFAAGWLVGWWALGVPADLPALHRSATFAVVPTPQPSPPLHPVVVGAFQFLASVLALVSLGERRA